MADEEDIVVTSAAAIRPTAAVAARKPRKKDANRVGCVVLVLLVTN